MFGYLEPNTQMLSGAVGSGLIASGSVQGFFGTTPDIASGTVGVFDFGSGAVVAGSVGSGAVQGSLGPLPNIASGTVGANNIGSGAILSGAIASGQIGLFHYSSGSVIDLFVCEQAISGVIAVSWGSGGCFIVPAERGSGLRLPVIGVVAGNFASGAVVPVVSHGRVGAASSGSIASGVGGYLYVGSGGLLVNLSGFMAGASSGGGPNPSVAALSGTLVQRVGVAVSGGMLVSLDMQVTSGLLSGLLGQF